MSQVFFFVKMNFFDRPYAFPRPSHQKKKKKNRTVVRNANANANLKWNGRHQQKNGGLSARALFVVTRFLLQTIGLRAFFAGLKPANPVPRGTFCRNPLLLGVRTRARSVTGRGLATF